MRTVNILLSMIVVALSVVSCDKFESGPEVVLSNYLDAYLDNRSEQAYGYLSAEDRAIKSLSEYQSETQREDNPFANVLSDSVSYDIAKITEAEGKAVADVEITLPDMSAILKDMMGAAFSSSFGNKDKSEIEKELREKYQTQNIPMTTESRRFELVKEEDGWKVFLDWRTQKAEQERQDKIARLMSIANNLRNSGDFDAAIEKYEKVLAIDASAKQAQTALEEIENEIAVYEEKQAYIEKLELKDFKVSEGSRFGRPVTGVFGTLVNHGKRTLKEVEVTVYFLNQQGDVIGEEDYHPVLVTEYSIGDNKLLKPGYVDDFGYSVEDDAPSSWAKKARAEITNIEFED